MPAEFLKHEHPLQVETLSEGLPRSSLRGSGVNGMRNENPTSDGFVTFSNFGPNR